MTTWTERLRRIEDQLVEDIMALTDEELRKELEELGEDASEEAERIRRLVRGELRSRT